MRNKSEIGFLLVTRKFIVQQHASRVKKKKRLPTVNVKCYGFVISSIAINYQLRWIHSPTQPIFSGRYTNDKVLFSLFLQWFCGWRAHCIRCNEIANCHFSVQNVKKITLSLETNLNPQFKESDREINKTKIPDDKSASIEMNRHKKTNQQHADPLANIFICDCVASIQYFDWWWLNWIHSIGSIEWWRIHFK